MGKGVVPGSPPQWVAELRADEANDAVELADPPGSRLAGLMSMLMGLAVMAALPAYLVAQGMAILRMTGKWRWAAGAPLLVMIPAGLHAALALGQSSNLWPIMLILTAPLGLVYLSGVFLAQRYTGHD